MEKIINVAQYIFIEYKRVTEEIIDEMKLQKLLYFSQRETFAILNQPLFNEVFEGWKYGPVSREVRTVFTEDGINAQTEDIKSESKYIINNIITPNTFIIRKHIKTIIILTIKRSMKLNTTSLFTL